MKYQYAKHIALALALLLTAGLSGCGKDSVSDTTDNYSSFADSESDAEEKDTSEEADGESGDGEESDGTESSYNDFNSDSGSDSDADASQNAEGADSDDANRTEASDSAEPDASQGNAESSKPDAPEQSSKTEPGDDADYEVGTAPTVGIGRVTAKPGQREVAVDLQFWNNPGYTTCGIQIFYDPALQPRLKSGDEKMVDIGKGDASDDLMAVCITDDGIPILAFGTVGTENNDTSGTMCTLYFTLPENAASGTVYLFSIAIDSMINENSHELDVETINGEICIE